MELKAKDAESLQFVLGRAQKLGFIGKSSDISDEIKHSLRFGEVAFESLFAEHSELACWDVGSGGGLPALPLCLKWPAHGWVLNDVSAKRCDFLEWAVLRLGLKATVHNGPVEKAAQMPEHKEQYNLVTSRAFGSAEQVAESAEDLLTQYGCLLVSSPPGGRNWTDAVLRQYDLQEVMGISVLKKKKASSVSHETICHKPRS